MSDQGLRLRLLLRDFQEILQAIVSASPAPRLADEVLVSSASDALLVDLVGFNILAVWPEAPGPVRWVAPSQVRIRICCSLEAQRAIRITWSVHGGLGLLQLLQAAGLMKHYMCSVDALDTVDRYSFTYSFERIPDPWREIASRWTLSEFVLPSPCGAALCAVAMPS
jgi:hypothetical protein